MNDSLLLISNNTSRLFARVPQPWIVIFGGSCFFFYQFFIINMMNVMNKPMLQSLHIGITHLGIISSSYFFASLFSLIPAGIMLDKFSTRKIITLAMTTTIISTFLFALAPNPFIALLARFIAGLSGAFCFISTLRLATRWFPEERLAYVSGLVVAFGMVGGILSQTPLSLLIDSIGWRYAALVVATIGLCLLYFVYKNVIDFPIQSIKTISHQHSDYHWSHLKLTLSNFQNWFAGLYISFMNLPIFILAALWGVLFLTQGYHLSNTLASQITTMIYIGMIVGSPIMGWLSDKLKRRKLLMVIFSFMMLFPYLFLILFTHQTPTTLSLTFFTIGFFCSAHIIAYSLIAENNSKALTGTAEGMASSLMLAGGLTQSLFGWFLQYQWSGKAHTSSALCSISDFNRALVLLVIATVIAIVTSFCLKESYCKTQNES